MKKQILIIATCIPLVSCGFANTNSEIQYEFPECGTSQLNGKEITKVCATRDLTAPKIYKDYTPEFIKIIFGAGHAGYGSSTSNAGAILGFENQELDMQGHVWDFSRQGNPGIVLQGHDSIIENGIILNADIVLGNSYSPPNFSTGEQINNSSVGNGKNPEILNYGFLYADNEYDCKNGTYIPCTTDQLIKLENAQRLKKRENMFIKKIKHKANNLYLQSWGGGILNSEFTLNQRINIDGSKANILNNKIISKAELDKKMFPLTKMNQSNSIDKSQQIFPDENDDNTAIPTILYVKFSPETVIDSNTFTLMHKNDQAYAIVLDHSPRVRISNNTFNGFKVPILMDQWSSIVDENGKEIKPENFNAYGNTLNPNKYAGNVTMNRKGEIVKE